MGFFDFLFGNNKNTQPEKYSGDTNPSPASNGSISSVKRWTKPVSHETLYMKSISFHVERYEEWQFGQCTSKGNLNFNIHLVASQINIKVTIPEADKFRMHNHASFNFNESDILHDRIQYVNAPGLSEDPTRPIILHIFVKNARIDCIRFAMSFPDRIIEFYGYQIESVSSKEDSVSFSPLDNKVNEDYRLTFLSSLINVATCDGEIEDVEMQTIMAYLQREGLSEDDLVRVITAPSTVPHSIPHDANLRAQHIRDAVTLSMVDGKFTSAEYMLCKTIAAGLGFRPEVVDIIRKELNDKIGANI